MRMKGTVLSKKNGSLLNYSEVELVTFGHLLIKSRIQFFLVFEVRAKISTCFCHARVF
jgi:hypothetical protein